MVTERNLFDLLTGSPSKNIRDESLDESFIMPNIPPEGFPLRDRKIGGCAHYSLKAVIEGKKRIKRPIEEYSADWWSKATYLMTPRGILKVLKKYKLNYSILKAKTLNNDEKLFLLKSYLKRGPIILLVANGQTRKKRFSRGKALIHRHYITLWGYDDKNKIFYVYDSNTKRKTEIGLMKGTLKVPYKYILKEWGIGASKIIYNNYAIAVKY